MKSNPTPGVQASTAAKQASASALTDKVSLKGYVMVTLRHKANDYCKEKRTKIVTNEEHASVVTRNSRAALEGG
jgi:hypothetical protein